MGRRVWDRKANQLAKERRKVKSSTVIFEDYICSVILKCGKVLKNIVKTIQFSQLCK